MCPFLTLVRNGPSVSFGTNVPWIPLSTCRYVGCSHLIELYKLKTNVYQEWVAALPDLPIDMENGIIETQSILENDNMRLGAEGEKKINISSIILQKLCIFLRKNI